MYSHLIAQYVSIVVIKITLEPCDIWPLSLVPVLCVEKVKTITMTYYVLEYLLNIILVYMFGSVSPRQRECHYQIVTRLLNYVTMF